jgi:maleate isomerase
MTGRIGLLVPFDTSNDRELWRWCPDDASLHITRTAFHEGVVGVPLAEATADLRDTAYATRSLKVIGPDVVAFACTSGSFVGGLALERALRETMLANGARRAVTTSGLMLDAFRLLGLRRLALATPYPAAVGERLVRFIEEAGYEAVSLENLGLLHGEDIQAVPDAVIVDLLRAADRPEADGIFLSCTGLGTVDLVATAERALGKPVLTAIQVTMWGALHAAGRRPPPTLRGQALLDARQGVTA